MAFTNDKGLSISYDCSALMELLQDDIDKQGGHILVDVVIADSHGVDIYKAYSMHGEPLSCGRGERIDTMTASALMELYEIENSII